MNQTTEILDKLNDEQIEPVLTTEGAVLVLAGVVFLLVCCLVVGSREDRDK